MYRQIPQANDRRRQWRKGIDAVELEWAKVHGGILYNKWYLLDCQDISTGIILNKKFDAANVSKNSLEFKCFKK